VCIGGAGIFVRVRPIGGNIGVHIVCTLLAGESSTGRFMENEDGGCVSCGKSKVPCWLVEVDACVVERVVGPEVYRWLPSDVQIGVCHVAVECSWRVLSPKPGIVAVLVLVLGRLYSIPSSATL